MKIIIDQEFLDKCEAGTLISTIVWDAAFHNNPKVELVFPDVGLEKCQENGELCELIMSDILSLLAQGVNVITRTEY